jgi:3D (Asp-Asp-Asp) domain-containing protein
MKHQNTYGPVWVISVMLIVLIGFNGWAKGKLEEVDEGLDRCRAELEELRENTQAMQAAVGPVSADKLTAADPVKEEPVKLVTGVLGGPQAETVKAKPETEKTSLGTFTVTFYCACPKCCGKWSNEENPLTASGARAEAGVTVGADWETLPEGTEIEIEGLGRRVVQDKPAEWIVEKYDGRIIDVFCASHEEALKLGKQEAEVWAWD